MHPYCNKAAVMKKMQVMVQTEIDVMDSVLGDLEVMNTYIFMRHKNTVISKAILPGICSCGITKLI